MSLILLIKTKYIMRQKTILLTGIFAMTFAFSSCKKAWECKCTNGVILNGSVEKSATVFADDQNEAIEKCNGKLNKKDDLFCNAIPNN